MDALGDVISEHRGRPASWLRGVIASGLMTFGIVWAIHAMHPKSTTIAWLIALGFAAITVGLVVVMVRELSTRLELRERGLVHRRGARETVVRYDEIARASVFSVNGRAAALTLRKHDGREITIGAKLTDFESVKRVVASRMPAEIPAARVRA